MNIARLTCIYPSNPSLTCKLSMGEATNDKSKIPSTTPPSTAGGPIETDIVADGKNIIVIQDDKLIDYFEKIFLPSLTPPLGERVSDREIKVAFRQLAQRLGAEEMHEIHGVIFLLPRAEWEPTLNRIPVLMEIVQLSTGELSSDESRVVDRTHPDIKNLGFIGQNQDGVRTQEQLRKKLQSLLSGAPESIRLKLVVMPTMVNSGFDALPEPIRKKMREVKDPVRGLLANFETEE